MTCLWFMLITVHLILPIGTLASLDIYKFLFLLPLATFYLIMLMKRLINSIHCYLKHLPALFGLSLLILLGGGGLWKLGAVPFEVLISLPLACVSLVVVRFVRSMPRTMLWQDMPGVTAKEARRLFDGGTTRLAARLFIPLCTVWLLLLPLSSALAQQTGVIECGMVIPGYKYFSTDLNFYREQNGRTYLVTRSTIYNTGTNAFEPMGYPVVNGTPYNHPSAPYNMYVAIVDHSTCTQVLGTYVKGVEGTYDFYVDASGNTYILGGARNNFLTTDGTSGPGTFLQKYAPNGSLLFSTVFTSNTNWSQMDVNAGVVSVWTYIYNSTSDAKLTTLNATTGAQIYTTEFGGSLNEGNSDVVATGGFEVAHF